MDTTDVKSAQIIPLPVRNTYSNVSMATPNVTKQRCGVFSPVVNHVVFDDNSREASRRSNLNDREIDGEKPHHIKAGIEPCTTEGARIVCRE